MESESPLLNFRRKKSSHQSPGLPNYALRLLEKRDTLDSISVCSTTSCSSGYLSDTSTSFDDGEDRETEMHSKVARAVRDLEIKSWRRRVANKKRMERRGSLKRPSLPSIVITEYTEEEAREADPGQWIEWGELGLLKNGFEVNHNCQTITSVSDTACKNAENTSVQSSQNAESTEELHSLKKEGRDITTHQSRTHRQENADILLFEEEYSAVETHQGRNKLTVSAKGHDDLVQAKINSNYELESRKQTYSDLAPTNWLSPRTQRQAHDNNHSAADDLENIFDELRHFSDGDKDFDCERIQRTSTPECQRLSPFQEQTPTSDVAAAFEDLLQIDEKYRHKVPSKRHMRSASAEDKVRGNVQASVKIFENFLAKPVSQSHRWRGEGYQRSEVRLTAETGHLVWTRPRGTLELVIGDGDKNKAFRCYLDPQNSGVKLSHLNKDGILELVLDGTEGPRSSRSERRISNQVGLKENYFRFHSHEGHVRLLLDALLDSKWDFFKMNYVIL